MFYNGVPSPTSIIVAARSDSNGDCVLTLNSGETVTVAADTSVNDGNVQLKITGLTPNTRYTYTVTIPDDSGGTGEITTFKDSGGEKLAYCSCEGESGFHPTLPILSSGAKCVINLGDETYTESSTFDTVVKALDIAVHNTWRKTMREKSAKMSLARTIGYGIATDDHDTFLNDLGDDTADPPASLNTTLTTAGRETMTAAEWSSCKTVIGNSLWSYHLCNPQNAVTDDTDPFYFSFEAGNMLVIVPALVMWTKTTMKAWPGTGPIMGANQLAWFKNLLSTTTKTFKVILSQKTTYISDGQTNSDDWDDYNDMDTVLQWIHDNSAAFAVPGGVIWGTGDWHSPGIGTFEKDVSGATYDHVVVNACPSGRTGDIRDSGNWTANTKAALRPSELNDNRFLNFGLVESTDDYVELSIKLYGGSTYAKARVNAGENKLATPPVLSASM